MASRDRHINFALMRDRILADGEGGNGKQYWRSLEEFSETEEFRQLVEREFPQAAEEWDDPIERRTFLKLMGASLALAGLSACTYQPPEKIVPYVTQPEEIVPGKALFFATAMQMVGVATGLLAKSNEGRPTKLEGNPDHPGSRGATDVFAQASLLDLYDPDRSQTLTFREEIRPWSNFLEDMGRAISAARARRGAGLRFLTETVTSPTLAAQLRAIFTEFPQARLHQYEPAGRDGARNGAMLAFGQAVNTIYRFDQADRIFSIDSDFLSCGPGSLAYAADFANRRRVTREQREMNRLYVVETTLTNTGAKADHRLALRPSELEGFVRAVAGALGVQLGAAGGQGTGAGAHANWVGALARDLQQSRGRSIIIPGDEQSAVVHALAHAMNDALGNTGKTVIYTDPIEAFPEDQMQSLRALVADMNAGQVETLVILGGNPVYNAPADLSFGESLNKVALRVHLSVYKDETSELCHWHIPEAHYLESWGDTRAHDGTATIIQPLIAPLYGGRTAHELLSVFSTQTDRTAYDILRSYWQGQMRSGGAATGAGRAAGGAATQGAATASGQPAAGGASQPAAGSAATTARNNTNSSDQTTDATATTAASTPGPVTPATAGTASPSPDFENLWRKAVHDGVIPNTALPAKTVSLKADWASQLSAPAAQPSSNQDELEIVFRTDPSIYDGRFANNGWLQELPKPLTKLTWDNALMLSPTTANRFGFKNDIGIKGGDVLVSTANLSYQGRTLAAVPVWILPGQPDGVITVHLGYGRRRAGHIGTGRGHNAYLVRTSDAPWAGAGARVSNTGEYYPLATTQLHFGMENRDVVRSRTLEEYLKASAEGEHEEARDPEHKPGQDESMYPPYDYSKQNAWGMVIDTTTCVGCNACVVACQAENNIPVVGKEQVMRSREMHWLRIDAYFKGDPNYPDGPEFMPVPCMHCENAPCEPVCPVHATVHDTEGLNVMVYNRCVGTRYCSNNCPYKVRRFNFHLYQDFNTPTYQLMRNPDVSVRSRGVMEKCTYCIQRIQWAKIESEKEGRPIADGEVVTACQAVCPTQAIIFGDSNDPGSRVAELKREKRNYGLLADLNTQPRTTYLWSLRNPNTEIPDKA
ncbi:MAG TPA: TAT-variant-translocated molybdopterin oxidoreductase [Pyrinomonadaceae bacterium]|jgi:molybdopterin-containing oxidoreductase family iron-sulfur binding subunit|nr:TAT-variant-translocated molybdopterin oxidoreductase [Pyrinomonadaceae bacterium]